MGGSPRRFTKAQRRVQETQAWEMAAAGRSIYFIGEKLDISPKTAARRVNKGAERIEDAALETKRRLATERHRLAVELLLEQLDHDPSQWKDALAELRKWEDLSYRLHGLPRQVDSFAATVTADVSVELAEPLRSAASRDAARDAALQNGDKP